MITSASTPSIAPDGEKAGDRRSQAGPALPSIAVAAGVIRDGDGQILIAQRPNASYMGGLWEFPGGKLESGESAAAALRRELEEELNIRVLQATPLIRLRYAYPDRRILLNVFEVQAFSGIPRGLEGQALRWAAAEDLTGFSFLPANRAIVNACRLGSFYAILDVNADTAHAVETRLAQLAQRNIRLVQFRGHSLNARHFAALAQRVVELGHRFGLRILLNAPPEVVEKSGAAGIHLTRQRLMDLRQRPLEAERWVAASCHDSRELEHADRIGVDFVVLSPIGPTSSHPDISPLGWQQFSEWVETVNFPVFALGGLGPEQVPTARLHGGQGIAGIRCFL